MKRFPRTPTMWGLALALAFASGCGQAPAPTPTATTAEASPEEKCEQCRALETTSTDQLSNTDGHLRSPWLEPNARGTSALTHLRVTDQDGRALDLSDLSAWPLALTFLYTRCTNPNRCPLVATHMGRLQKLVEAEKLDDKVGLAVMTYDPDHDTPEVLKQYGLDHGLRFTPHVRMLRPDAGQRDAFFDRLRVTVNYNADGVNLHGLQLFLFDGKGRFVRRYQSVVWDNAEVLADLKRLAEEDR